MPRTLNHQPFLDDILHRPKDDNPRLIYADWLTEHGDPRGEFIRIQCRRAKLRFYDLEYWVLRQQELAMLVEHREEWAGDIAYLVNQFQFYRGFPSRIRVVGDGFLENADQILALTPIEDAVFDFQRAQHVNPEEEAARILKSDRLKTIDSISLSIAPLELVLDSPHISHLKRLRIEAGIYNPGLTRALECKELENLESLSLKGGRSQWFQLFINPHLKNLKCLRINGVHSSDRGEEFYESPLWSQLECLGIGFSGLNSDNVDAFLATAPFAKIKALEVNGNKPHYREMFASKRMENLISLSINSGMQPRIVNQIIEQELLPNLRLLCRSGPDGISEESFFQLLLSPVGRNLMVLFDGAASCIDQLGELPNLKHFESYPYSVSFVKLIDEKFGTSFAKSCEFNRRLEGVEDWNPFFA